MFCFKKYFQKVINIDAEKYFLYLLITFLMLYFSYSVNSQIVLKDTTVKASSKIHSPKIATISSMLIPGLGQVYNKKIWKVPIIYVGLGTLLYYFDYNDTRCQFYKDTLYSYRATLPDGAKNDKWTSELIFWRDKFRRYRDLNIIGLFAIYFLNIIDANVDANLFDFDVSDNLSFRIEPFVKPITLQKTNTLGVTCRINF